MKSYLKLNFTPSVPFDFKLSLHKRAGWYWLTPFEIFQNNTLWSGTRINHKSLGLKIKSFGTISKPKIEVEIFANDKLTKEEKEQLNDFLFQALKIDQNLLEFYRFSQKFPVLKECTKSLYGMHTASNPDLFHSVVRTVSSHMCRTKRAIVILDAIFKNYGEKIKFDNKEITLWPTKEKLNTISEQELREKCNLGYRAKFLKSIIAIACEGKFPERKDLLKLLPEEAKKKLMEFKGVGEYTAEILSPHSGFPLDVWSVMVFWKLLGIKKDRSTREMIPKVKRWAEENWGPWRGLAFTYILNDLESLKKKFRVDVGGTIADYIKEKKEARLKKN